MVKRFVTYVFFGLCVSVTVMWQQVIFAQTGNEQSPAEEVTPTPGPKYSKRAETTFKDASTRSLNVSVRFSHM